MALGGLSIGLFFSAPGPPRGWVAGDASGDRVALVSVAADGATGNGASYAGPISGDGRYVAFGSGATNLVAGDTGIPDVYVEDRQTGAVERVSVAADGTQADRFSGSPAISGDGHPERRPRAPPADRRDLRGRADPDRRGRRDRGRDGDDPHPDRDQDRDHNPDRDRDADRDADADRVGTSTWEAGCPDVLLLPGAGARATSAPARMGLPADRARPVRPPARRHAGAGSRGSANRWIGSFAPIGRQHR